MKKIFLFICCHFVSICLFAQAPPSHQLWDQLLKKNVTPSGMVNYKGFQKDKSSLDAYLKILSNTTSQSKWSVNDQKAFWINAYNAFTVSLILKNYPVKSIKNIGDKIKIPFVNTPWDIKFINIGGKKYDLNNIEHGILRKIFNDPRIHFALVCASMSCPRLRKEAYTASQLHEQLEHAGKDFINDKSKNIITPGKAELSKYFSWYKGDFTKNVSLVDFINKYSQIKINSNTRINYLDYDWRLNEQK